MIEVVEADLALADHAAAVVALLDQYACDPMGGGTGLTDQVKQDLVPALEKRAGRLILLALRDGEPVGLLNSFEGFSTFAARPLLNIHDVYVHPSARGLGVGRALFVYAERASIARGYCKMTLEVLTGNVTAQRLYLAQGFAGYALDDTTGHALFWQKRLP
jgi:ribosomal protein S18 acetylase RimI-like enzyme